MRKAPKLLTIVVLSPLDEWPEIVKLREQGHNVISFTPRERGFTTTGADCLEDAVSLMVEADIVLGPQCWRMTKDHRKYLSLAIKAARLSRYPKTSKKREAKKDEKDPIGDNPDAGC